jgi:hypothetical protein
MSSGTAPPGAEELAWACARAGDSAGPHRARQGRPRFRLPTGPPAPPADRTRRRCLARAAGSLTRRVQGIDFVAASFIRKADDVIAIRAHLDAHGGERIKIISKIENQEGLQNFDDILKVPTALALPRVAGTR